MLPAPPLANKRKASLETRLKQSVAHLGDKHHYFGLTRSDETKAKISKTLSGTIRFDFDGTTALPLHMKTINESGTTGYAIVGYPGMMKVQFSSKRSMAELDDGALPVLRAKCIFYLDHLNMCAASGVPPSPKNVYMKSFSLV